MAHWRGKPGVRALAQAPSCKGDIVEADLEKKHKSMCEERLRLPARHLLALGGDHSGGLPRSRRRAGRAGGRRHHLENFGTWTDKEGRLVWGVNDYDEAAEMPYILDLVRLATSAALAATPSQISLKAICTNVLEGYAHGIEAPEAFVLDREHLWLRKRFVVGEAARAKFWQKIENQYHDLLAKKESRAAAGALAQDVRRCAAGPLDHTRLLAAQRGHRQPRPPALARLRHLARRAAAARRQGAGAVRLDARAWRRHASASSTRSRFGKYRTPDPWYAASGNLLMRRLSPNNRKINAEDRRDAARLLHPDLLWAMGRELAAIHLGARDQPRRVAQGSRNAQAALVSHHVEIGGANSSAKNTRNGKNRLNSVPRYRLWEKGRHDPAEKRRTFRALHESGCFVIPNPWNVGTARYLQGLGFKALATTSSGFAHSQGYADGAQRATRCSRISARSRRPPTCRSTPTSRTALPTIRTASPKT